MDNENKKDANELNKNNEEIKEKRKSTLKTIIITVIVTLLIVILILFLTIFCLKNCSSNNNKNNSGDTPIDTERNNKITDIFKDIVKKQLDIDGFDLDELETISAVTYNDNYPTSFDLNIVSISDDSVYYYSSANNTYPTNVEGYDNFLSYLLIDETSHILNGEISLNKLNLVNERITTNKSDYKYIISKASNEDRYLSGFYYEDNNFFIYYKHLLINDDPFIGVGDQLINNTSPLYDYYRGLLN